MFKKVLFISGIMAASLLAFVSLAVLTGSPETLKAASEQPANPSYDSLKSRIEQLESVLTIQEEQEQDSTEQGQPLVALEQHLSSIADSLVMIAENSAELTSLSESMKVVVERLAGIEEELAWYRLDREENAAGEEEPEQ